MPYTQDIVEELNILVRYNLTTTQEGLKVHKTAAPDVIAATQRLFSKGLITREDGGYLTHLGLEAAERAQAILDILKPTS
ncbi:MAG: TIGR02647 family protein [Methylococcaceae bacterium]|nr:TIGR02647 family protein [Methylococcaceae bacterium]